MDASARARYFGGLHLAAYATWAAVAFEVLQVAARWAPLGPLPGRGAALLLLLTFLAAFIAGTGDGPPRRSLTSLAVMTMSALGLLLLGRSGTAPILLIILSATLAAALPWRQAITGLVGVNAALLAILLFHWRIPGPVTTFVAYAGFQAFAALVVLALARAESMAAELQQVNARLLATRSLLDQTARDAERLRVARELHDVAGHKLTALKLNLELLARDPALAPRRELAVSKQLAAGLLDDVRSVVSSLRRDQGIDLREALQRLADPFPHPRVHVDVVGDARVGTAAEAEVLLRAAQEGLTNAARHANAANVWLTLAARDQGIELVVEDDGPFEGAHAPGHGLTGMRERLQAAGGSLESGRGARGGFRLAARLPAGTTT